MKIIKCLCLLGSFALFNGSTYGQGESYEDLKQHIVRNLSVKELVESSRMSFYIELSVTNGIVKSWKLSDSEKAKYFRDKLLLNYEIKKIVGKKKGKYILPIFINPTPSVSPPEKEFCMENESELYSLLANLFVLDNKKTIYLKPILLSLRYGRYD